METQEPHIPTLLVIPVSQIIVVFFMGIALLNGEHAMTLFALLLLGMATGTRIWSRITQKKIVWKSWADNTKIFPDELLIFRVHVENHSWLPLWLRIGMTAESPFLPVRDDTSLTQASGLLWYQQVDFQWVFMAQRRGVYSLGAASMQVGDLLGFFPKKQPLQDSQEIVVYPRLVPLKSIRLPQHDIWGKPGARHPIHDPVYILGTREYQHSQPAKYIHWKASAHYNRLHVKLFEPSRQEKILFLLDVTQFVQMETDNEFEQMIEVMASLGARLIQQGYSVGCLTNGRIRGGRTTGVRLSSAPNQTAVLLEMLARVKRETIEALSHLLLRGVDISRAVRCLHFTFQYDEAARTVGKILGQRHIPSAYVVCRSPDENIKNIRGKVHALKDLRQAI